MHLPDKMRRLACVCILAALAACSPAVSSTEATTSVADNAAVETHPESGLPVKPLFVKSKGQIYKFRAELAVTPYEQAKGLMFRTAMGPNEGMLFPFNPPRDASFWMKNTVIPLDMVFIGADHRILNIEANAVPYSEAPRQSQGKAAAVLELVGGRAAQLGIGPGDKVEW